MRARMIPVGTVALLLLAAPPAGAAGTGSITGTVTAASGGAPIQNAHVCAMPTSGSHSYALICENTDAAGAYTITGLDEGPHKVEFDPPSGANYAPQYYDGKPSYATADEVTVSSVPSTGIDAQLVTGGTVEGTVTDAATHGPVANAGVCVIGLNTELAGCTSTNGAGEYTITGIRSGSYKVQFSSPSGGGYLIQYFDGAPSWERAAVIAIEAGETKTSIDAALEKAASISGKVTDAHGASLEGAEICAYRDEAGTFAGCASSAPDGTYSLGELSSGEYLVEFSPPPSSNYLKRYYNDRPQAGEADLVTLAAGAAEEGIDAALPTAGEISGTVIDAETHAALEGVRACALAMGEESLEACATTDASGGYTIAGLPTGGFTVRFERAACSSSCPSRNYLTQYYDGSSSPHAATTVSVQAGRVSEGVNAAMHAGGQIAGVVTGAPGGNAIAGARVCARTADAAAPTCAESDGAGDYTIPALAAGSYTVRFTDSGSYAPVYFDQKPSFQEAAPVEVELGRTHESIDAELPAGGQIAGTVTAAEGEGPLEGIDVCTAEIGAREDVHCAYTDSAGKYTVQGLGTGSYTVLFRPGSTCGPSGCEVENYVEQAYDGREASEGGDAVAVTAGQVTSGIDAALRPGGRIVGHVAAAAGGASLADIWACASEIGGEGGGCEQTDGEGDYGLSALPTGSYAVRFFPAFAEMPYAERYYDERAYPLQADPVQVSAGETRTGVDANLVEGGRIEGHVAFGLGEALREAAQVCARRTAGGESEERCGETNVFGRYSLTGMEEGSYVVEFRPGESCGLGPCRLRNFVNQFFDGQLDRSGATPVQVQLGAARVGVDATLAPGGEISGLVTDALTSQPVWGAEVCAYRPGEEEPEACAETDSEGSYELVGLSPGPHLVEFQGGWSCNWGGCSEDGYPVQFYDGKSSAAAANSVEVTVGGLTEGIDAAMGPLHEESGSQKPSTGAGPTGSAPPTAELPPSVNRRAGYRRCVARARRGYRRAVRRARHRHGKGEATALRAARSQRTHRLARCKRRFHR